MRSRSMVLAAAVAAGLVGSTMLATATQAEQAQADQTVQQLATQEVGAQAESFIEHFDGPLDPAFWYVSDGYNNGDWTNCQFNNDNVVVANGQLSLSIDDTAYGPKDYSCGAIQTNQKYHYGIYETRMLTGPGSGTNSSLFTYAGPYQGIPQSHEIDFETLGKDTTKTEVNTWVNGVSRGGTAIDLGKDNAVEWVNLGFIWTENEVAFYVDGVKKYSATGDDVPYEPQLILNMIWSSDSFPDWMGPFEYPGHPIVSKYEYTAFTAFGDECQFEASIACGFEPPSMSYIDNFDTVDATKWRVADGWHNGETHNCMWDKAQATASNGILNLSFAEKTLGDRQYACAELQSKRERGYGTYEARIKGVRNSGLMSAMFTYVGASGDLPAESIDVKLFGNNTDQVQFNTAQNGTPLSSQNVDLPAPAEQGFIDYGLVWTAERMDFYINGEVVHSVTDPAQIPTRDTKLFLTIWASENIPEMGDFEPPSGTLTAQVDRVAYTAPGEDCQFEGSIAC